MAVRRLAVQRSGTVAGRCTPAVRVPGTCRRGTGTPPTPDQPDMTHGPPIDSHPRTTKGAGITDKLSIIDHPGSVVQRWIMAIPCRTVSVQVAETHGLAVPCRKVMDIGVFTPYPTKPSIDLPGYLELWTSITHNRQ